MNISSSAKPSVTSILADARGDLRYAVRLFARQPAILLLTIGGLSLGLGIATAAFSLMNAAVLRGDGLADPDRAPGVLRTTPRSTSTTWTYAEFLHLREGATRLQVEGVLAETATVRTGSAEGDARTAGVAFVSGGFFAATGARVFAGRALEPADERHAGPPPVVVSHAFWLTRLDRDPRAVGRTIRIGRTDATIVGVAARGFAVPGGRLLWMPLTAYAAVYASAPIARAPETGIQVFGRLLPGVAMSEAEAQLTGVATALPAAADQGAAVGLTLDPHAGLGRVPASDTLAIAVFVFAVIGLVLLLAWANVASVLVSTAIPREREMGVRAALGASRSRLVRQLVTESLALGTIAAVFGLLCAQWAMPAIGSMIEAPPGADLAPDRTVYLFLGIVTIVTGVGAGLAPAWHGRGADLVTPLKGEGASPHRLAPRRLRVLLVMTQAAVSVLLIVLAALFVRATFRAAAIDVGFDAAGLYTISPGPGAVVDDDGARVRQFWTRAIAELEAVPGIAGATLVELAPFGGATRTSLTGEGPSRLVTYFNRVRADYFEVIGTRLLAGRTFTREEIASRAPVAVVSETLARTYWRDQSPIGQLLPEPIKVPEIPTPSGRLVVVGVAADAITARLHEHSAFAVYEPLDAVAERDAHLILRVASGTGGALQQASERLRAIDQLAEVRIASVDALLQQEASQPRTLAALTGVVGLLAIVLCVIGLYGLTASVVAQRTRELGVRLAMGARPRDLRRLLIWDSLRPVVAGVVAGGVGAVLISQVVAAAMFFGVAPHDPLALAGASALLLAATVIAVLAPARRAATVDAARVLHRS